MNTEAQASFLRPFTPLPRVKSEGDGGDEFSLVATAPVIIQGFALEHQRSPNWCWAPVVAAVTRQLRGGNTSQDDVARVVLGNRYPADEAVLLQPALVAERVDRGSPWNGFDFTSQTFEQYLKPEIDAGRPLCIQIVYPNGFSHFMALFAYAVSVQGTVFLYIQDPADQDPYPDNHGVALDAARYCRPGGTWLWTYFTGAH